MADEWSIRAVRSLQPADAKRFVLSWLTASKVPLQRHPLGFLHGKLNQNGERIHIWTDFASEGQAFAIHDHIFDLESYVMFGMLEARYYESIPAETHSLFEVEYFSIGSTLVPTGKQVGVVESAVKHVGRGERYSVAAGVFHSSVPMNVPTVTLVHTSNPQDRAPRVIGPLGHERKAFVRSPITERDRQVLVESLMRSLIG